MLDSLLVSDWALAVVFDDDDVAAAVEGEALDGPVKWAVCGAVAAAADADASASEGRSTGTSVSEGAWSE